MTTSAPWTLSAGEVATDAAPLAPRLGAALSRQRPRLDRWLPAPDVVLVGAVLAAAPLVLRTDLPRVTALLLGVAWLALLAACEAWARPGRHPWHHGVMRAGACLGLGCWAVDALLTPTASTRDLFLVSMSLVVVALAIRAMAAAANLHRVTRVAVAGGAGDIRRLLPELRRGPHPRWEVASICLEPTEAGEADLDPTGAAPVWTGTDALVTAAGATGATAVIVAPGRTLTPEAVRRLCWTAQEAGLDVLVATGLHDVDPGRARLVAAGTAGLARLQPRAGAAPRRLAKDLAERAVAAALLFALLPLMGLIALLVCLDSPGGALFRQQRVGRGHGTFTMYKFRTMTTDAEVRRSELTDEDEGDGVRFKIRLDPRVTRVGSFLRRYSLDELPQLVNVLRGEMSLVGPRPALPHEVAQYDEDSRHRLVVKPGLTGLWQVSGRSDLSWEESVRLDLHYVDNWSLGLDARIMLRTAKAVVGHRGAY